LGAGAAGAQPFLECKSQATELSALVAADSSFLVADRSHVLDGQPVHRLDLLRVGAGVCRLRRRFPGRARSRGWLPRRDDPGWLGTQIRGLGEPPKDLVLDMAATDRLQEIEGNPGASLLLALIGDVLKGSLRDGELLVLEGGPRKEAQTVRDREGVAVAEQDLVGPLELDAVTHGSPDAGFDPGKDAAHLLALACCEDATAVRLRVFV
jgi:hypothetical protein